MANATKHLLAQALEDLLETKPLNKVTVKELVEKSGVNRQTFYYNFPDIYALVEWIFEERARPLLQTVDLGRDWRQVLQDIVQQLPAHKALVMNTVRSLNRVHLERYLRRQLQPYIARVVAEKAQGHAVSPQEQAFICDCYTAAFVGLALEWIDTGMSGSLSAKLDLFIKLVDGSLESVLCRFEGGDPANKP